MADAAPPFDRPSPPPAPVPPRDWAEAFAALPQETAPADAFAALAVRARTLRRARRHRAWRSGLALVATLACAAVGLALWSVRGDMRAAAGPAGPVHSAHSADHAHGLADAVDANALPAAATPGVRTADGGGASPTSPTSPGAERSTDPRAGQAVDASTAIADASPSAAHPASRAALPGPRRGERPRRPTAPRPSTAETLTVPVERRLAVVGPPAESGTGAGLGADADTVDTDTVDTGSGGATSAPMRIAASAESAVGTAGAALPPSSADTQPTASAAESGAAQAGADDSLQRLQARSAQLETWLASLRDTSVGTGPGALIAAEFDDRLSGIDAALAVVPSERADVQRELWQARVALLQRALGFERDLRALAAEGRDYDGALVAVD